MADQTPEESQELHEVSDSDEEVVRYLHRARYIGIVGSRFLDDAFRLRVAGLIHVVSLDATIVSGGAPGVDTWAEELAAERGLLCAVVRPSRKGSYRAAEYFARNDVIVRGSQVVVAFWNGKSRGTLDSINKAIDFHGYCIVVTDPSPATSPEIWRISR
jgi:hypothetical protein